MDSGAAPVAQPSGGGTQFGIILRKPQCPRRHSRHSHREWVVMVSIARGRTRAPGGCSAVTQGVGFGCGALSTSALPTTLSSHGDAPLRGTSKAAASLTVTDRTGVMACRPSTYPSIEAYSPSTSPVVGANGVRPGRKLGLCQ